MVSADRNALMCDFAETYGILDWQALPLETAAALAAGLSDDSRIKIKVSGRMIDTKTALLAAILDRLTWLCWTQTKDGQNGENPPESVLAGLTRQEQKPECRIFQTAEDFRNAWERATKGVR